MEDEDMTILSYDGIPLASADGCIFGALSSGHPGQVMLAFEKLFEWVQPTGEQVDAMVSALMDSLADHQHHKLRQCLRVIFGPGAEGGDFEMFVQHANEIPETLLEIVFIPKFFPYNF